MFVCVVFFVLLTCGCIVVCVFECLLDLLIGCIVNVCARVRDCVFAFVVCACAVNCDFV